MQYLSWIYIGLHIHILTNGSTPILILCESSFAFALRTSGILALGKYSGPSNRLPVGSDLRTAITLLWLTPWPVLPRCSGGSDCVHPEPMKT